MPDNEFGMSRLSRGNIEQLKDVRDGCGGRSIDDAVSCLLHSYVKDRDDVCARVGAELDICRGHVELVLKEFGLWSEFNLLDVEFGLFKALVLRQLSGGLDVGVVLESLKDAGREE